MRLLSNIIKSSRVVERSVVSSEDKSLGNTGLKEELLEEAKEEYEKIILAAKEEAREIIDSAYEEYEDRLSLAYERAKEIFSNSEKKGYDKGFISGKDRGFKEGYQKGYEEGKKDSEILIKEALEIKNSYIAKRNSMLIELEQDIIHLVITIYEKVLNKKIEEDKELIVSLVLNGIENLEISEKLTIIISQEDFDIVDKSRDIILAKASLIDELDVRINSNMEKGDCILETSKGSVDVSINNQLDEVKDLLISILSNE